MLSKLFVTFHAHFSPPTKGRKKKQKMSSDFRIGNNNNNWIILGINRACVSLGDLKLCDSAAWGERGEWGVIWWGRKGRFIITLLVGTSLLSDLQTETEHNSQHSQTVQQGEHCRARLYTTTGYCTPTGHCTGVKKARQKCIHKGWRKRWTLSPRPPPLRTHLSKQFLVGFC